MFNIFNKKSSLAAPVKPKLSSLFSTDVKVQSNSMAAFQEVMARNMARAALEFRPVDADGNKVKNAKALKPVKMAMDYSGWSGSAGQGAFNGIGTMPMTQLIWYAARTFVGYQISAIVAQHWLVDKICTMPARDALRKGYELTVNDGSTISPKQMDDIKKLDKEYRIRHHAEEFVRMCKIFGIRIAMFKIETGDPTFYQKPFNIDGVRPGSYKGIVQIDPYWVTPELDLESGSDPASMHFYEPTWWRINGTRYHRTHLIIIRNGELPDVLKPTYLYGGVSVPQKIAERVFASERTANEAPMLAATKRSTIFHIDMVEAMANQGEFEQKMQFYADTRDNYAAMVLGHTDLVEQFDISLTDLDSVIMTQYQIVAAIGDCPATKVLGTSPKGFNATGEFEMKSYHETLETIQTHDMEPLLERHYLLLAKSNKWGFELQIVWNPVDSPGAKEEAEINLIKAQTGNALVTSGAIDGTDERARIIADETSGYSGISSEAPEPEGDIEDDIDEEPTGASQKD